MRSRSLLTLPVIALLALGGCTGESASQQAAGSSSQLVAGAAEGTGVKRCNANRLPAEVSQTVKAIQAGGPFIRRRQDGSTYQNRNRELPVRPVGFYREYTVRTPGANNAGARRVVTGGNPKKSPPWYFYTADHYDTFCQLTVK